MAVGLFSREVTMGQVVEGLAAGDAEGCEGKVLFAAGGASGHEAHIMGACGRIVVRHEVLVCATGEKGSWSIASGRTVAVVLLLYYASRTAAEGTQRANLRPAIMGGTSCGELLGCGPAREACALL